jgi:hypothetical protein
LADTGAAANSGTDAAMSKIATDRNLNFNDDLIALRQRL